MTNTIATLVEHLTNRSMTPRDAAGAAGDIIGVLRRQLKELEKIRLLGLSGLPPERVLEALDDRGVVAWTFDPPVAGTFPGAAVLVILDEDEYPDAFFPSGEGIW